MEYWIFGDCTTGVLVIPITPSLHHSIVAYSMDMTLHYSTMGFSMDIALHNSITPYVK